MWVENLKPIGRDHSPPSNFPHQTLDLKRRPFISNLFLGKRILPEDIDRPSEKEETEKDPPELKAQDLLSGTDNSSMSTSLSNEILDKSLNNDDNSSMSTSLRFLQR